MPFKMVQNLSSNTSLKPSRTFRRIEKEMGSTLWGQSGCSSAQLFLPEGEARRPKYCENDSFCGSSGLLGIRKCHKSQERDCRIPSPYFRLQRFRCILLYSRKTSRLFEPTSQPGSNSTSS